MKSWLNFKTVSIVLLCIALVIGGILYSGFLAPNLNVNGNKKQYIFVYPNQNWDDIVGTLEESEIILSSFSYKVAVALKYADVSPQTGKYDIEPNLSNRYLLNRIAHGLQSKILLRLVSTRSTEKVARNISSQVMVDSISLMEQFHSPDLLEKYNLTTSNSLCLFLPFNKEITWDIHIDDVMDLIETEYTQFWDDTRKKLAKKINLTPAEVHILASIVEEETNNFEDKKMVAGLYLNRLNRDMLLQADPTVRYATGNFALNRILKKHLTIDSPFNTYIYGGLPPAPIRIPTKESIDAVLHYTKHPYIYMVAKSDFSGTHDFSRTFQEHLRKARAYQRQLNKRGIFE
jgi:UPF0755 protein